MDELQEFRNKFNIDGLTLFDTKYWIISLRPKQPTIASVIISLKRYCQSLGDISVDECGELPEVCKRIENIVTEEFGALKFNYLALMMVDSHVHFHVIPRYDTPVVFRNEEYKDSAWPKPVDIFSSLDIESGALFECLSELCE